MKEQLKESVATVKQFYMDSIPEGTQQKMMGVFLDDLFDELLNEESGDILQALLISYATIKLLEQQNG